MPNNEKAFKIHFKEEDLDILKWRKEVDKELKSNSDRAIAIVCASILDLQLEELLTEFMIDVNEKENKIRDEMFKNGGPFSTFSGKIKACYLFGLISEDEYKNINILRGIRNEFAHQLNGVSFENTQSIKARCNNLYIPKNRYIPASFPLPTDGGIPKVNLDPFTIDNSSKNRYVKIFDFLSTSFIMRKVDVSAVKRTKFEYKLSTADEQRRLKNMYEGTIEKHIKFIEKLNDLKEKLKQELPSNYISGESESNEKYAKIKEQLNDLDQRLTDNDLTEQIELNKEYTKVMDYAAAVLENSYID